MVVNMGKEKKKKGKKVGVRIGVCNGIRDFYLSCNH
jgi:hypothetical protein